MFCCLLLSFTTFCYVSLSFTIFCYPCYHTSGYPSLSFAIPHCFSLSFTTSHYPTLYFTIFGYLWLYFVIPTLCLSKLKNVQTNLRHRIKDFPNYDKYIHDIKRTHLISPRPGQDRARSSNHCRSLEKQYSHNREQSLINQNNSRSVKTIEVREDLMHYILLRLLSAGGGVDRGGFCLEFMSRAFRPGVLCPDTK